MPEENIRQEFRLKSIVETRNYFFIEINQNELMSKKHKKVCRVLNHTEHLLIIISTITGCFHFSFCFFNWYFYRNYKFCSRIKVCLITAGIKKYKSIIKEKEKET